MDKIWSELNLKQRGKLLDKIKLDTHLINLEFEDLPPDIQRRLTNINEDDLLKILSLIVGVSLLGLFLNIMDSPPDKPLSQIKDEPIEPDKFDRVDRERDFTHPSSFIGKVTYTPEFNTMEINLNGKVYGFCGVPERIFDAFEGAASKGAYFGRNIKGQFNC